MKRVSLLLLCVLLMAERATAITISPTSISGNGNAFNAEFDMAWGILHGGPGEGGIIAGTWEGGTWEFLFGVVASSSEGFRSFTIRTFWNDGWIPGGLGDFSEFDFGQTGTGFIDLFYRHPPLIAQDFSGLGLQYYLDASAFLTLSIAPDSSGSAHLTFNFLRTPVPEAGSTFAMLAFALLVIHTVRRRVGGPRPTTRR